MGGWKTKILALPIPYYMLQEFSRCFTNSCKENRVDIET